MQARYSAAILLLMLASLQCAASETNNQDEAPGMDMLEFLGRWETTDGKWVDPTRMDELNQQAKKSAQGERNEK